MTTASKETYMAGVYKKVGPEWDRFAWSRNLSPAAALNAATGYRNRLRRDRPSTDPAKSRTAWYVDANGRVQDVE